MVTGFEEYTKPLTDDEKILAVHLMKGFERRTIKNPIVSRDIMAGVNVRLADYGVKSKLTEARLRKIVNHIRAHSLQPLMGTTRGYYLSDDPVEIRRQIQSLKDRSDAILHAARGLEEFLNPKSPAVAEPPKTLFDQ